MDIERTISDNVNRLMTMHGIENPGHLAREAKISPRMAAYVVNAERTPSVEILLKIAQAFGVSVHQLITPNLSDDVLSSRTFPDLLRHYAQASQEGRNMIDMQAQREAAIETTTGKRGKRPFKPLRPLQ